ncbi:OmpA family protein [Loktanella sp. Alg231-35]|uniref:OmpA family protein n=1 Tax=Loktanella sp. Alg231-35 TaxID=1922220 RepID=UPI00131F3C9E|nr:OmpA family protein [Loktanella sp. Alg231-35]
MDNIQIQLAAYAEFTGTATSSPENSAAQSLPQVVIAGQIPNAVTIPVTIIGGTATLGVDFAQTATSITVPAGLYDGVSAASFFTVPITITADTFFEPDETIVLQIGTPSSPTVQIAALDCTPPPSTVAIHTIENDDVAIDAMDDTPAAVSGFSGGATATVLGNDTLNGGVVNPADITLSRAGTASDGITALGLVSPPSAGSVTMNADGELVVAPGTTAGTYVYTYEICEVLNPTNCDTAEVTVVVDPTDINAIDDTPAAVDGATGATIPNVVANDTVDGVANPTIGTDVTVNVTGTAQDGTTTLGLDVTPTAGGISLDPANGEVTVDPGTTAGTYVYTYEICEVLNPTNCDTAEVTVVVEATPIVANDDAPPSVEGVTGGTIPNVVANDTLSGVANPTIGTDVTVNEAGTAQDGTTTLGLDVTPAAGGITLDPATGEITVAPGTTGGVYNYTYEICEVLNPTNCDTANVIIGVTPFDLISRIEEDLEVILEEDLANTLTMQSYQISGYSADALDRLRDRGDDQCLAAVNIEADNILFDVDKAIIKPESRRTLDTIAAILASCPGSAFEISGHTDSDASNAYNLDLSQRRVEAVLRALTARDIDATGYIARGYGESQPIASNATAAGKARNRRVEFRALTDEDGYSGPCEDSFSLVRAFDALANDDGANADGHFLRDEHDCITDRREVFEGTLSFSDTNQGQTQTAINLSYRQEHYRGRDSVFGYFVGMYASQSDVSSRATGEIRGLGINAGIYGANRLYEELSLDYYLGAATGRHEFDLAFDRSIGTITATGDYSYVAGFAGAAISGELEYGETKLTPRVGFDYVYTPGADVDVLAEIGALSEAGDLELDAISGGRIFAEIRTDRLVNNDASYLWFNPRIACYQSLGNLDGVCGIGGSLGIESADEDSELTYAIELDGEKGNDYFLGNLRARASRQIGPAQINGDAGFNSDGNVTMGANLEMKF